MKNLILLPLILIIAVACNSKTNTSETVNSETTADTIDNTTSSTPLDSVATQKPVAELFACPMHSEITGEKDEKCPKCGMKLTEPIIN